MPEQRHRIPTPLQYASLRDEPLRPARRFIIGLLLWGGLAAAYSLCYIVVIVCRYGMVPQVEGFSPIWVTMSVILNLLPCAFAMPVLWCAYSLMRGKPSGVRSALFTLRVVRVLAGIFVLLSLIALLRSFPAQMYLDDVGQVLFILVVFLASLGIVAVNTWLIEQLKRITTM